MNVVIEFSTFTDTVVHYTLTVATVENFYLG